MIYDELRNYLTQSSSAELVTQFDEAIALFEQLDVEYLDVFDAAVGESVGHYDQEVVDRLVVTLSDMLSSLVSNHGVHLVDDASLNDMLQTLKALVLLSNWEDKAGLNDLLCLDQSPQETVAELLARVLGLQAEHFLPKLGSVNPSLLTRLKELMADEKLQDEDFEDCHRRMLDYAKVKRHFHHAPNWADQFARHHRSVNMPLAVYVGAYAQAHADHLGAVFNDTQAMVLASDLLHMLALSQEGLASALVAVRAVLPDLCPDLNNATKVDMACNQHYLEIASAQG